MTSVRSPGYRRAGSILAASYRDRETRKPFVKVLYNFGRADQLDTEALRRLVRSISRYLEPSEAQAISERLGGEWPFEFLGSRRIGGSWLLDGLWKRLGVDKVLKGLLGGRGYTTPVERLLFAMVANRALAPSSKLGMERWVAEEALIDGLPEVEVHQLYRAMDFLLEAEGEIRFAVFSAAADLFDLEVDLVFLDTTSTFFEIEGEDEGDEGLRKWGFSKDRRSDLAQVVGFAVTRTGIPVRSWVWPGNTADESVIEEVKRDLNGWKLGRVVVAADAGFNSKENRRILQGAGGHYILGEKLRLGVKGLPAEVLSRAGSYRTLESGLEIKEVVVGGDSEARRRFVVVRNPEEAERDRTKREDIVAEAQRRLGKLEQLNGEPHRKAACRLRAHPTYGRYIRQTRTGKLRLDKARIRTEERFDGKFLVSSSDDGLSAEDIVLGYKQLAAVERVFPQAGQNSRGIEIFKVPSTDYDEPGIPAVQVAKPAAAWAGPSLGDRLVGPAVLPLPKQSFDPRGKFLYPDDDEYLSSPEPSGDLARYAPGGSPFLRPESKGRRAHRRFCLRPFLTCQATDSGKRPSPSGQRI